MQTHVKVLAAVFIVLSACGILAAFGVGALFGMLGLAGAAADDPEAAVALPVLGITGAMLTGFMLVMAIPGLVTGFGLLGFKSWARILGIVLCAIQLIGFPIGTIIGAYGLWVLLNKDTERLFASTSSPAATL